MSQQQLEISEENFGSLFNRLCQNTEHEIKNLLPDEQIARSVETLFQNMKTKILFLIRFQLQKSDFEPENIQQFVQELGVYYQNLRRISMLEKMRGVLCQKIMKFENEEGEELEVKDATEAIIKIDKKIEDLELMQVREDDLSNDQESEEEVKQAQDITMPNSSEYSHQTSSMKPSHRNTQTTDSNFKSPAGFPSISQNTSIQSSKKGLPQSFQTQNKQLLQSNGNISSAKFITPMIKKVITKSFNLQTKEYTPLLSEDAEMKNKLGVIFKTPQIAENDYGSSLPPVNSLTRQTVTNTTYSNPSVTSLNKFQKTNEKFNDFQPIEEEKREEGPCERKTDKSQQGVSIFEMFDVCLNSFGGSQLRNESIKKAMKENEVKRKKFEELEEECPKTQKEELDNSLFQDSMISEIKQEFQSFSTSEQKDLFLNNLNADNFLSEPKQFIKQPKRQVLNQFPNELSYILSDEDDQFSSQQCSGKTPSNLKTVQNLAPIYNKKPALKSVCKNMNVQKCFQPKKKEVRQKPLPGKKKQFNLANRVPLSQRHVQKKEKKKDKSKRKKEKRIKIQDKRKISGQEEGKKEEVQQKRKICGKRIQVEVVMGKN